MYNVAFTGIILLVLQTTAAVSPEALKMIRTIGIFWATFVSSAVFVLPRLLQGPPRRSSILERSTLGMNPNDVNFTSGEFSFGIRNESRQGSNEGAASKSFSSVQEQKFLSNCGDGDRKEEIQPDSASATRQEDSSDSRRQDHDSDVESETIDFSYPEEGTIDNADRAEIP
jgi:hypothetical protein